MTDPRDFLKASGYLDSPAQRFFWLGASPTFRNHLRQWSLLTLFAGLPISLLMGMLTSLQGSDRALLFLVTLTSVALFSFFFDIALGLMLRLPFMEGLAQRKFLNAIPIVLGLAFFLFSGAHLYDLIASFPKVQRISYALALGLASFCAGASFHMLLLSRLYWHGIRPPEKNTHTWLTIAALLVSGLLIALNPRSSLSSGDLPQPRHTQPVTIIAMDIPPSEMSRYQELWQGLKSQTFEVKEKDLIGFWTSMGTGMQSHEHRSSLVLAKTALFKGGLSRKDPTVTLPLWIMDGLGLTSPMIASHRFKYYSWEILAQGGLNTMALGYWLTYPVTNQHGITLSERWQPEFTGMPYSHGVRVLKTDPLPIHSRGLTRDALAREKQIWAQLALGGAGENPNLTFAYLPLADMLNSDLNQQKLAEFRKSQMETLRASTPEDAPFALLLSSGKDGARLATIEVNLFMNEAWQRNLPNLNHPYQLAGTLLNYFGFPADKKMVPSAMNSAENALLKARDYGERELPKHHNQQQNLKYYQDLRALGYIQ